MIVSRSIKTALLTYKAKRAGMQPVSEATNRKKHVPKSAKPWAVCIKWGWWKDEHGVYRRHYVKERNARAVYEKELRWDQSFPAQPPDRRRQVWLEFNGERID